jgi:hypothetical protein
VLYHKLGQARRQSKVNQARISLLPNVFNGRDAVYVALHEVTAEPVANLEGALEVHSTTDTPITHRRTPERRLDGGDGEPPVAVRQHGQARAIDGDALAVGQVAVPTFDAQLAPRAGHGDVRHAPDVVD